MNNIGPSMELCSTLKSSYLSVDSDFFYFTDCLRSARYDVNHISAVSEIPNSVERRLRRILWSIVSKEADRSRSVRAVGMALR